MFYLAQINIIYFLSFRASFFSKESLFRFSFSCPKISVLKKDVATTRKETDSEAEAEAEAERPTSHFPIFGGRSNK